MNRAPATATLIVSPLASRIRAEPARHGVVEATREAIRRRGHAGVEVVETGEPAAIAAAAAAAVAGGHGLVVLAGGDGTIRDASRALAGTGIEVGIVPCGTGNLYASSVGIPRQLEAAVEAIAGAPVRPYDVGVVQLVGAGVDATDVPVAPIDFVVACGTGFDAAMIASTDREMKRRHGVAAYFLAASRLLPSMTPRPTVLVVDGERTELESVVVLVANCGEAIPGVLRPRLPIEPDDGVLHVFVLPRGGVVGGIRGVLELMNAESHGISPSGHAVRLVGRDVRVEVEPAGPTQIDGDPFPAAWLHASIQPGGLRVIRGEDA
ncbi:MAG TPA: diacylglycerol kinase family protein [Candidatus Limnocylindrales bacterium]|nr:diacylglycerol kinase family protein [Candidatus Limnocylindrales bacterium]